ncbi:outer membrane protein assembly factor BamE domain-containing protein [Onishia niordana]|uniref:outer membrane protein assembly factor BamE domain-containing protein n=1 Tax=Onishia niordana TaxID=2508711 RepID=UPI0010A03466|nr:outer membrane protein assembly factor BamE [Halomonas niordiana]
MGCFKTGGLLLLTLWFAGCQPSTLTLDNYQRLSPGMTREEVEAVIGEPSECAGAMMVDQCRWGDEARYIQGQFLNGKAVAFQYQGLR